MAKVSPELISLVKLMFLTRNNQFLQQKINTMVIYVLILLTGQFMDRENIFLSRAGGPRQKKNSQGPLTRSIEEVHTELFLPL